MIRKKTSNKTNTLQLLSLYVSLYDIGTQKNSAFRDVRDVGYGIDVSSIRDVNWIEIAVANFPCCIKLKQKASNQPPLMMLNHKMNPQANNVISHLHQRNNTFQAFLERHLFARIALTI